jgi:hypothetical protein
MIAITKWIDGTWEPGHGFWGGHATNFDKPQTLQTLIDPSLIQGVEPYVPWSADRMVGTPPECCRVYLGNGNSFEVVGNYKEIAKLAGIRWNCQYCGGTGETCPHCGAPRES